MVYQKLDEGYIDHNAFIVGLSMGLGFGVLELFFMSKLDRRINVFPILIIITTKVLVYTLIIFMISSILGLISGLFEGKELNEFYQSISSVGQFYLIIFTLIVFTIIIFFLQISRLLGDGVLFKLLYGKYNKPVEEDRIFMFLDLKSSTTIAEKIGHEKFYSLLNSFFHEITEPVLTARAHIYQYVGDEIVFTWETRDGIEDANCLQIFFSIKKKIEARRDEYLNKYGLTPQFKAGVHFGKVIVGQIGDLKSEIVYNGDVLNTTARIQELCNEYNRELLISRSLVAQLNLPASFDQEYLGKVKLKGKEKEIHIYAISERIEHNNIRRIYND
jgi:adenylate cyclase